MPSFINFKTWKVIRFNCPFCLAEWTIFLVFEGVIKRCLHENCFAKFWLNSFSLDSVRGMFLPHCTFITRGYVQKLLTCGLMASTLIITKLELSSSLSSCIVICALLSFLLFVLGMLVGEHQFSPQRIVKILFHISLHISQPPLSLRNVTEYLNNLLGFCPK